MSKKRHDWEHNPQAGCALFIRFLFSFGFFVFFMLGGIGLVIFVVRSFLEGGDVPEPSRYLICGLFFLIPFMMWRMGRRAYRGIATPLAEVMSAADAVAEGDLSVRVKESRPGDFNRLAQSFNRMASELERAEKQRQNLTADIAHELRTPLHIIQGNLEGVLDGVYEPTPDHLQATLEETHQLARLVSDLRTLSLAEAGQLPLVMEEVDLPELLTDVQTSFSGQAEEKEIELLVQTAENLPLFVGDIGRLDQVLSNLVVNSLRHTPAGGTITLSATPSVLRPPSSVTLQVSDTGEGIPAEDLPFIFDRFWRGDKARTRHGSGGGLGLAITKQLVRAHNGKIEAESEPGRGTTITIQLPIVQTA